MKTFSIRPWGPPALQEIFEEIAAAINERCPVDGLGIRVSYQDGGAQINQHFGANKPDDLLGTSGPTGGSSGTNVDLFGVEDGQPATFHLVQTAPPTLLSEE